MMKIRKAPKTPIRNGGFDSVVAGGINRDGIARQEVLKYRSEFRTTASEYGLRMKAVQMTASESG